MHEQQSARAFNSHAAWVHNLRRSYEERRNSALSVEESSRDEDMAFEDSLSGIRSAQAAGMRCVVIRNVLNAHLPVSAEVTSRSDGSGPPRPVNYLVDDFDALPLSVLDASEDAR